MEKEKLLKLQLACVEMRKDCLIMAEAAGKSGMHFGGSLSIIEIVASLYIEVMNIDKSILNSDARDRFILSKGHGVPTVYAALKQLGILTISDLLTFKKDKTKLYGHPCMNREIGIEFSTGSLGQGLSLGVGSALGLKMNGNIKSRVFVVMGDGECNEGAIWEAALSASKFKLDNLIAIIDHNHLQYDGDTEAVLSMEPLENKWKSFGWDVMTIDGHDVEQCCKAFSMEHVKPLVVIADTIKGKGISFMENQASWHHNQMTKEQNIKAWEEISK